MKAPINILAVSLLIMAVAACSRLKPEDMYRYSPLSAGEVPASIQRYSPINGLFEGLVVNEADARIFNARVAAINGRKLFDFGYYPDPFPEGSTEVLQLSPGPAEVTVLLEGKASTMFAGNAGVRNFQKMAFSARPGERYKIGGGGKDTDFTIWIEDSAGRRVVSKNLIVQRHYSKAPYYNPNGGTSDAVWSGIFGTSR